MKARARPDAILLQFCLGPGPTHSRCSPLHRLLSLLGFNAQLCHLPAVQPWASYLTSLKLNFLFCEQEYYKSLFHRIAMRTE